MELATNGARPRRKLPDNETMSTNESCLMIGFSSCHSMGVVLSCCAFMVNQVEQPKCRRWDTMVHKETKKQPRACKENSGKVASGLICDFAMSVGNGIGSSSLYERRKLHNQRKGSFFHEFQLLAKDEMTSRRTHVLCNGYYQERDK